MTRSSAVVPMLAYEDPATAIEWLERAFGFREQPDQRYMDENGTISHAQLEAGEGLIMLASPTPDYQSPKHHSDKCEAAARWLSVPWVIDGVQVEIDDVEAHYARAQEAGARLLSGSGASVRQHSPRSPCGQEESATRPLSGGRQLRRHRSGFLV